MARRRGSRQRGPERRRNLGRRQPAGLAGHGPDASLEAFQHRTALLEAPIGHAKALPAPVLDVDLEPQRVLIGDGPEKSGTGLDDGHAERPEPRPDAPLAEALGSKQRLEG